eukprot:439038_1
MNRISLISRRTKQWKQSALYMQSIRSTTSFEHYHKKYNRPDRWRVEPFPISEPYHHNTGGMFMDVPRLDGGTFDGRHKKWTYHYKFLFYVYMLYALTFYCARQYIEYENLFTWGKEEALSQMNYRSMRDEELIYLWVRYNQFKQGLISEDEIYRREIKEDYGWENIY